MKGNESNPCGQGARRSHILGAILMVTAICEVNDAGANSAGTGGAGKGAAPMEAAGMGLAVPSTLDKVPRTGAKADSGGSPALTSAPCAWPVEQSVEALLQAETEAVLRTRQGLPPAQPAGRKAAFRTPDNAVARGALTTAGDAHGDHVAVTAIYGVGRRLHVDVRINGRVARYRPGRRWPEHAPGGGAGVYALAAVLGECVRLQGTAGTRLACLDAAGPERIEKE